MSNPAEGLTKQEARNWIIVLAVGSFVASIIYSPHHVKQPFIPYVSQAQDYIEYGLIWDAPHHSSLEFSRLVLTWLGVVAVAALALYLNRSSSGTTLTASDGDRLSVNDIPVRNDERAVRS
jgi:branched-subunit amino acid ABC-type transport system permease component